MYATQYNDDKIVVQVGNAGTIQISSMVGNPFGTTYPTTVYTPLPFRVKIYKLAKK